MYTKHNDEVIFIIFQVYHDDVVKVTKEISLSEPLKYKVRDIANKMAILDREVKYLVNKAKIWKPKEKPAAATNESKIVTNDPTDEATVNDSTIDAEHINIDSSNVTEDTKNEKSFDSSKSEDTDEELHQEL